jgi:hypothetical protein
MARLFLICIGFALFLLGHTVAGVAAETLTVAATSYSINNYRAFMQGRTPLEITSFASPHATRAVVSMILMQKALKIGGMGDVAISFLEVPNSARERAEVKSGHAVIGGQDFWNFDFDDSVYMTDPIIQEGSFIKGIYVLPSNKNVLGITNMNDLRPYSAVILGGWRGDINTLESMKPREILLTYCFDNIFKFINLGRADFTLLEFSSAQDLTHTNSGTTLTPIPGIKVTIPGYRCLMISKKHPDGKRIYEAVNNGLKVLRKNGTITKAFTESGFLNEKVKGWKSIN